MSSNKVENLDELLRSYTGETKKIIDTKISPLISPGENYGSILLKLDIILKNNVDNSQEELHTVAKIIPSEEMLKKVFNIQVTCKVEIAFYDTIVPTLNQFQIERGLQEVMDIFPKMYAGRINLNGSDIVDENAILILENLKEAGYQNVSRFESFDLPTIKLILKDLAAFHAVPLALKLLKPEVFESKIKPYLKDPTPPSPLKPKDEKPFNPMQFLYELLDTDEESRSLIPKLREKLGETKFAQTCPRNEPLVTMVHSDMWVNNIMTKFQHGIPVANKFVDFQMPTYQSPAGDLFFLLWSSVQKKVLEEHLDELVRFYHDRFIEHLHRLKCDVSEFSLERLYEELKSVSTIKLGQVFFMTAFVIFHKPDGKSDFQMPYERKIEDIPEIAKERIIYMVKTCMKKRWI